MCGLIKKTSLKNIDIGYSILPEYSKIGYEYEIAQATMNYAKNSLNIKKIVAITSGKNLASIKVLKRISLRFEQIINLNAAKDTFLFS